MITVLWNRCELYLILLLAAAARMTRRDVWAFVHDLGDLSIANRIKTFALFRGWPPHARELIDNALQVYDACRQNRNLISHAWTLSGRTDAPLMRRSKKPIDAELTAFPESVVDLRRVAKETEGCWFRLSDLMVLLEDGGPLTLLEKLPVPELLGTRPRTLKAPRSR